MTPSAVLVADAPNLEGSLQFRGGPTWRQGLAFSPTERRGLHCPRLERLRQPQTYRAPEPGIFVRRHCAVGIVRCEYRFQRQVARPAVHRGRVQRHPAEGGAIGGHNHRSGVRKPLVTPRISRNPNVLDAPFRCLQILISFHCHVPCRIVSHSFVDARPLGLRSVQRRVRRCRDAVEGVGLQTLRVHERSHEITRKSTAVVPNCRDDFFLSRRRQTVRHQWRYGRRRRRPSGVPVCGIWDRKTP